VKLTTTRQAIHDALSWGWQQGESSMVQYLTYLTKIEKSIKRGEPCGDFLEAGYICAAINTLPSHIGGWLKFAYGYEDSKIIQTALASKLRFDLFAMATAKKHNRLLALAETSLEDFRLRTWQYRELPNALYCERLGILQPNYYRDGWGNKQNRCLDLIKQWDREGVGQVSRMVRSLKGDSEETASQVLESLANDKTGV
jgi:hypothetical protein